jgi:hypothetical protein
LTTFGDVYHKGSELDPKHTWYELSSDIDDGVEAGYNLNIHVKDHENKEEIKCTLEQNRLMTSSGLLLKYIPKACLTKSCISSITVESPNGETVTASGYGVGHPETIFTDSNGSSVVIHTSCSQCIYEGQNINGWTITEIVEDGKLAAKCGGEGEESHYKCNNVDKLKFYYKEYLNTGKLKVKEHYHTHEWLDGSKVDAKMEYKDSSDETKLHLVYNNKDREKECSDAADTEKYACKALCDKKDKACNKACDEAHKDAKKACTEQNKFQIKMTYDGYYTLSIYDILKLVGYE